MKKEEKINPMEEFFGILSWIGLILIGWSLRHSTLLLGFYLVVLSFVEYRGFRVSELHASEIEPYFEEEEPKEEDKVTEAIKGSIKKWEKIRDREGVDRGPDNCPLCKMFWKEICEGCPVEEKAGVYGCKNTPWKKWVYHHYEKHTDSRPIKNECPTCTKIAQEEVDFLKSLLKEPKYAYDKEGNKIGEIVNGKIIK